MSTALNVFFWVYIVFGVLRVTMQVRAIMRIRSHPETIFLARLRIPWELVFGLTCAAFSLFAPTPRMSSLQGRAFIACWVIGAALAWLIGTRVHDSGIELAWGMVPWRIVKGARVEDADGAARVEIVFEPVKGKVQSYTVRIPSEKAPAVRALFDRVQR